MPGFSRWVSGAGALLLLACPPSHSVLLCFLPRFPACSCQLSFSPLSFLDLVVGSAKFRHQTLTAIQN